jgi:hypothetical protein
VVCKSWNIEGIRTTTTTTTTGTKLLFNTTRSGLARSRQLCSNLANSTSTLSCVNSTAHFVNLRATLRFSTLHHRHGGVSYRSARELLWICEDCVFELFSVFFFLCFCSNLTQTCVVRTGLVGGCDGQHRHGSHVMTKQEHDVKQQESE